MEKSMGKKISRYLILAVVTGCIFALLLLLSVYLFDNPADWKEIAFESGFFGLITPFVDMIIDRHYNNDEDE